MKVRKATLEDYEPLKEIISEMLLFESQLDSQIDRDYIKKRLPSKLRKNLLSKKVCYFVAEEKGEFVGYSGVEIEKSWSIMTLKEVGHIFQLYVRPNYRKRGIAERLCKAAFLWFNEKKLRWYKVLVYINNPHVKNYYEKYGFEPYVLEYRKIVK